MTLTPMDPDLGFAPQQLHAQQVPEPQTPDRFRDPTKLERLSTINRVTADGDPLYIVMTSDDMGNVMTGPMSEQAMEAIVGQFTTSYWTGKAMAAVVRVLGNELQMDYDRAIQLATSVAEEMQA